MDDLLVRLARHVQEEGFVGFDGQPRRYRFQARLVADAENFSRHFGGDAEAQQLPSLQLPEDAWFVGGRWVGGLLGDLSRLVYLQRPGFRIDVARVPSGPLVSVVVLVGPQQHVDVAVMRFQDDGPIAAVDANRAHVRLHRARDLLVVEARGSGVPLEPPKHGPHLALLL